MKQIGVGIIGTGFMGKAHAVAYRAAGGIFPDALYPRLVEIADIDAARAARVAEQLGFESSTSDWKSLVCNPAVDVVSITTPNSMHCEMALVAIAARKHVLCEKPIASSAADAKTMFEAAEAAGVITQVGYNYIQNPVLTMAKNMIAAGELGDIISFRGIHAEDYMADPDGPFSWRVDGSGAGVLADLGSHIIGMARFLLGPITAVLADLETVIKSRPLAPGSKGRRVVVADDIARLIVRFARGCSGSIEASWVATGRKMQLSFELVGTKGALVFSQERLNELLYYRANADARHAGFTRIEAGPQHPPYGNFCVAPGHQLGFNDLKTIEVGQFLEAIAGGKRNNPDFREGWEIQKVIDAAVRSSREKAWLELS